MTETNRPNRVPEFKSREEEAAFWDTHDTTDYAEEFRPITVRFARNLSEGLTVRLDPDTMEKLRREAHEKGIGPTTLARMLIKEHFRHSQS